MKLGFKGLLLGAAVLLSVTSTKADVIWSNVSVVANTAGNAPGCCLVNAIYDEEGLITPYTPYQNWSTYFAGTPLHTYSSINFSGAMDGSQDYEWFSSVEGTNPATGEIVLDMGSAITTPGFALWNEDSIGVYSMDVQVCTGFNGTTGTGCTDAGTFYPTANTVNQNYAAQLFTFPSYLTGRYVELFVTANSDDASIISPGYQVAIGSIAFDATPEPGTWMLMGFGLLAVAFGRRIWARRMVKFSGNAVN
jgi:hypothetical protein